jgi:hypothetical protein
MPIKLHSQLASNPSLLNGLAKFVVDSFWDLAAYSASYLRTRGVDVFCCTSMACKIAADAAGSTHAVS